MAEFRWRALNALQRQQSGILLADNSEQAEALLLAQGYSKLSCSVIGVCRHRLGTLRSANLCNKWRFCYKRRYR